jgi:hypothetical protein
MRTKRRFANPKLLLKHNLPSSIFFFFWFSSLRFNFYPLQSWERPYHGEICTELNVERYDLRKDGNIGFSHPYGTHDDVFWSLALAVYATTTMAPEQFVAVVPRG